MGYRAVPIVALMAFLIGVVLAFQGSAQLRQFGAEVFVVDLIAISILRELGILLTAIIVAGRTASAFTAAIGSMKMREEIDAMRTPRPRSRDRSLPAAHSRPRPDAFRSSG